MNNNLLIRVGNIYNIPISNTKFKKAMLIELNQDPLNLLAKFEIIKTKQVVIRSLSKIK